MAKARIGLIKAERDTRLALVGLAEKMGISGTIDIISNPLIRRPTAAVSQTNMNGDHPFDLSSHPLAMYKTAEIFAGEPANIALAGLTGRMYG